MTSEMRKRIAEAKKRLVGRRIVAVGHISEPEARMMGWAQACPIVVLEDGQALLPMSDPEGNGPGAFLHLGNPNTETTIPPISLEKVQ